MTSRIVLALALITIVSWPAAAQSFDCRKATTGVERMICADAELSKLDEQMARAFTGARTRGAVTAAGQAAWLKDIRNRCADAACLKGAYQARIAALGAQDRGAAFSVDGLAGEWSRRGGSQYEGSTLVIDKVTPAGFHFEVVVFDGGHMGQVEGVAVRTATEAVFKDEECQIRFSRTADRLVLAENSSACAGAYVAFGGDYAKGEKSRFITLTDLGILAANVTEKAFEAVVGKDYQLFTSSFQQRRDEKDLDGLSAKVVSGAVSGLFTEREAIVMSRTDGKVFAAVIDDDVIKYFSNDPAFKAKLPATIDEWRSTFADKKVVFASVK